MFTLREKAKIYKVFEDLYKTELLFHNYENGEIAIDKQEQIEFHLLGVDYNKKDKESFDPKGFNRKKLVKVMIEYLPDVAVEVFGLDSIIVKKNVL